MQTIITIGIFAGLFLGIIIYALSDKSVDTEPTEDNTDEEEVVDDGTEQ